MSEARENSVKQLAELYNVVVGVALSLAMFTTIDKSARPLPINWDIALNLVTLIVIMVPFYHGAVRHLFYTYAESAPSKNIKNGALLADFFLLFMEGCFFVMLASLLDNTLTFTYLVIGLLVLDSVWGFLAWLAFTGAKSQFAEKKWAFINTFAAGLLLVLTLTKNGPLSTPDVSAQAVLLIIISLRTIVDYSCTWSFYFPDTQVGDFTADGGEKH